MQILLLEDRLARSEILASSAPSTIGEGEDWNDLDGGPAPLDQRGKVGLFTA